MAKTAAERQKQQRERMRSKGFMRCSYWIKPEWKKAIKELIVKLEQEK